MATLLTETFTGSDGAAWSSSWTTGRNPSSGGGATIQGNLGRLGTGTAGGYSGNDRISRRANITAPADVDIIYTFKFDATEVYPRVYARANTAIDSQNGYYVETQKGSWTVGKSISYATTVLSSVMSYSYTQGTLYSVRFNVAGSSIKAKLWAASSAEPVSWSFQATDTSLTAAGVIGFTAGGGSAAGGSFIYLDDVTISDAVSNAAPTVNAGADAVVTTGTAVARTAVANDTDGSVAAYAWTITSKPGAAAAAISGAASATMSLIPDVPGVYILRCTATDNLGATGYDELTITASYPQGVKNVRTAGIWQPRVVRTRRGGVWV